MKVIMITEENHGIIGLVTDYRSAILYLIDNDWLHDDTEIYDDEGKLTSLIEHFGAGWADLLINSYNIDNFNSFFEWGFSLIELDVVSYPLS